MANDNKNAPQSQGQGNDPAGKNAGRNPGSPTAKPQYDTDRPGYDVDVETEIPGGGKNAPERDQPGPGKSGMGWDAGNRPETDRSGAGTRRPEQRPDEERQSKKGP